MLSLLSVRVTKPIGETAYVTGYAEAGLQNFFKKTPLGVLIFTNSGPDIEFTSFGIHEYKNRITFGRAPESEAHTIGLNITSFPAFIPFSKGKIIEIEPPEHKAAGFLRWLDLVLNPTSSHIKSTEELRLLLEGHVPQLFGIDINSAPSKSPKGMSIHFVQKSYFEYFGISVQPGLYLYRPLDRELIPYDFSKTLSEQIHTNLTLSGSPSFYSKLFIAGYAIDKDNDELCEKQHAILKQLASKYGSSVSFAVLEGKVLEQMQKDEHLESISAPFFIMSFRLNTSARWFVTGAKMSDPAYLDSFVSRVLSGQQGDCILSEDDPMEGPEVLFRKTTHDTFKRDIIEPDEARFLVFTASWCPHCKHFKPVLREAAKVLKDQPVKFYWMDGGMNDWPEGVPEIEGYPTAFIFPSGKKNEKPMIFDGKRKIQDVIDFVANYSNTKIVVPEYNATLIEQEIHDEIYPKKKQENTP